MSNPQPATNEKETEYPSEKESFRLGAVAILSVLAVFWLRHTDQSVAYLENLGWWSLVSVTFLLALVWGGGVFVKIQQPRTRRNAFMLGLSAPAIIFAVDIGGIVKESPRTPDAPATTGRTVTMAVLPHGAMDAVRFVLSPFSAVEQINQSRAEKQTNRAAHMAYAFGAADSHRASEGRGPDDPSGISTAADRAVALSRQASLSGRVLWVDDDPKRNNYEREALESMGLQVERAASTEEAERLIEQQSFDLVISDFKRTGDDSAGYTLLESIRKSERTTPYIIYSGTATREQVKDAKTRGALGQTNLPSELADEVARAVRVERRKR